MLLLLLGLWQAAPAGAQAVPALSAASAPVAPLAPLPGVPAAPAITAPASITTPAADSGADLAQLRTEVRQQQELVQLMRHRLANADTASTWLPWVGLGLVFSLALAGWLGLRLLQLQRDGAGSQASRRESRPPDSASPFVAPPVRRPGAEAGADRDARSDAINALFADADAAGRASAAGSPTTTAGAMAAYQPEPSTLTRPAVSVPRPPPDPPSLSGDLSLTGQLPREVSVEELLDLEQQVDFFMVLGQEESAVDLLVSHIRGTGGTNALPYLKLLEVYRLQGRADAYERTRSRFNLRFNAYAPEWSAEPDAGRLLEDYPGVIERLQRLWSNPLDAMADLESMLFRRDQGELFDLPAYREVLLLYALARDLHEQQPVSGTPVDVLLPLDDEQQETTSPRPHLGLFSDEALGGRTAEWARSNERGGSQRLAERQAERAQDRPLERPHDRTMAMRTPDLPPPRIDLDMALDIDLSEFSPPPREFTQPAAFNDVDPRSSDFADFDDPPQLPTTPTVPTRRG
ncbi:hypothetical protein [Aquabacterium sp. OR-4]|uniref:hypothetical protein n=1 Tax=Aquabacterium sp. OR-4 TaxID=2978127 RepID=UPI0028CAF11C|nr:hypothetical protein [Aquabacterium sp. OR-4]MDT7834756.1 hypothetical protein [Aquabacterium sp. OR-4]